MEEDFIGNIQYDVNCDINGKIIGDIFGNINGNMNGEIIGNIFGTISRDVNGNIKGNLEGKIMGDIKGRFEGDCNGGTIGGDIKGDFYGKLNRCKVVGSIDFHSYRGITEINLSHVIGGWCCIVEQCDTSKYNHKIEWNRIKHDCKINDQKMPIMAPIQKIDKMCCTVEPDHGKCPSGRILTEDGLKCQKCPRGHISDGGGIRCLKCLNSQYPSHDGLLCKSK